MIDLRQGDARDVLTSLASNSVDSVVTDPPYALTSIVKRFGGPNAAPAKVGQTGAFARASAGFMGQKWDNGETAFDPAFWSEVLRVLKPGGHVAAFGGTRTYHRLAVAIEDAGFEIRDMVSWIYGTGFPKSHDLGEGRGTALKPALEPIVLARKPFRGTVAANLSQWGTGAIYVDGCRIETSEEIVTFERVQGDRDRSQYRTGTVSGPRSSTGLGRFPANVCHDGSDEVLEGFPFAPGAQSPVTGQEPATGDRRVLARLVGDHAPREPRRDPGSAARFFYCAKASRAERVSKCSVCGDHYLGARRCECLGEDGKKAAQGGHPTVKPVSLKRWIARLITPPGGLVLDPFAGTGTTAAACLAEGFSAILVEREPAYVADIMVRLTGGPAA